MGLLESLQKIGFGNVGPSGTRQTGASRFSEVLQQRLGIEKSRGVAQAIAAASKDGTPVSFEQMSELAEKWGIPLREVMSRVQPINEKLEHDRSSKVLHNSWMAYQKIKKMDPGRKMKPQEIVALVEKHGGTMGDVNMFIEGWSKTQGQTKHVVKSPQQQLVSIGQTGEAKVELEAESKPPKPTSQIEQYNLAVEQFKEGLGTDPKSFTEWKRANARAGATRIDLAEKVKQRKTFKDVDLKATVQTPKFKADAMNAVKQRLGSDWDYLEPFEKDEHVFREMDKNIKEIYKGEKVDFGVYNGKEGWHIINEKTKKVKLIKLWKGSKPLDFWREEKH